jgi:hypothetical protein
VPVSDPIQDSISAAAEFADKARSLTNTPTDALATTPSSIPTLPITSLANSRTRAIKTSPRDLKSWSLARSGKNEEQIAGILDCSIIEAQQGIVTVNTWLASVSNEIVNALANEEVLVGLKGTGKVLNDAKLAERVISPPIYNKEDGRLLAPAYTVPDHTMRLEAIKVAAQFAKDFKPPSTAPAIALNIGNTVNNNISDGKAKSFEQRVRELREKRGLHSDEMPIMDAVLVDDDDDDEDEESDDGLDADGEYIDDGDGDDNDNDSTDKSED